MGYRGAYMEKSAKQSKLLASFKSLSEGDKNLVLLISDTMLRAEKSAYHEPSKKIARKEPALHGGPRE
jgi:hypothetical protein